MKECADSTSRLGSIEPRNRHSWHSRKGRTVSYSGDRVHSDCWGKECRSLVTVLLVCVCTLTASTLVHAQSPPAETTAAEDAVLVERNLRSSAVAVSDAVVRVKSGSQYASTGIIVSAEGHVAWPGLARPVPELSVALSSGESVAASNLGWSVEWQVGLLKLEGDRKWPHVEFGSTEEAAAGDRCFEVGYYADEGKEGGFTHSPIVRFGRLNRVSPSHWFATDLEPRPFEHGAGTFDAKGRLLGVSVPGVTDDHRLSTAAEVFVSQWRHFADGKNLDWVRYPPSKNSLYRNLSEPSRLDRTGFLSRADVPGWKKRTGEELGRFADAEAARVGDPQFKEGEVLPAIDDRGFRDASKVAAATTVRILKAQPREGSSCWSGVLISPEGHIATCAHTLQVAGEKLVVVLPGGREAPAVALGTNWVSDIGLVEITEKGLWVHAELGDSSMIGPDDGVLCAGFPAPHVDPLPPVTMAVLPLQQTPYVGWSHELSIALSMKLLGGCSGGGVFDRDGRLVAIYTGPGGGRRIEVLLAQKKHLMRENPMVICWEND
jgi:serine protease Do